MIADDGSHRDADEIARDVLRSVRTIAVVGASPNPARASSRVLVYLMARGYDCIAVNPGHAGRTIHGAQCVATLADLPHAVDMVDVFRRSEAVPGVVDEVLALDPLPRVLWLQLGIRHDEAAARARAAGLTVVQDACPAIEIPRLLAA